MAVAVTRHDHSAGELRREAARSRDAGAARRMLAIALVLEGASREDAAESCGMDRQTLRDWVHRYNAEGLPGLLNRRAPGPASRLSSEQEGLVARWVEDGPELERDGVVRWRCRDLQERIRGFCQLSRQGCRRMRADAVGLPCRKYGEGGFRATEMKLTAAIGGNMLVVTDARAEVVAEFVI